MKKNIPTIVRVVVVMAVTVILSFSARATITNIVCNPADYTSQPSGVNNSVSSATDAIGFAGNTPNWCAILMFPLPTLPPGKMVGPQTTMSVTLGSVGASTTINGDLWGVANFRNTLPGSTPDSTYWYYLADNTGPGNNATPTDVKLVDNFLTPSLINQAGATVITPTGTTNNLQNYIQNFYANNPTYDASVSPAYVWLRINADSNSSSTANRYVINAGESTAGLKPALNLDIVDIPTNTLVWDGGTSTIWDDSTANWKSNNITGFNYQDGDGVVFDDTFSANPAITLNTTVLPSSVMVNNTVDDYSIGGSGKISGAASLLKLGTNTLILDTDNDYSGGTTLAGGTLQIGNGDTHGSLGSGPLINTVSGTTLAFNRTDAISVNTVTRNFYYSASIVVNSGTVSLIGDGDNSGTLATVNNGATLILAKPNSGAAHALGSSSTINVGGTLQLGGTGGDQLYQNVYLTNNGTFDLAGLSEGLNGLIGNGLVTNSAAVNSTLQLGDGSGSATFAGSIVDGIGTVSLIKTGTGVQTLNGTNAYSGGTIINAGELVVTTAGNGGDYTVTNAIPNNPGIFGINIIATNDALHLNNLNLWTSKIEFQKVNSSTVAPLQVGTVTVNGTVTINIANNNIVFQPNQSYPLIAYTNLSGSANFVLGTLPAGVSGTLDTSSSPIKFVVANVPLTWNGNISGGLWDNSTPNWKFGSTTGLIYSDDESITFDDTLSGTSTVDLETVASPLNVTFSNNTHSYLITGNGYITGPCLLTKTGTNTLILDTDNDFYGGVALMGGTLQIGNNDTHGSINQYSVITNLVGGSILAFNRTDSITVGTITRTTVDNSAHIVVNSGTVSLAGSGDNAGTLATVNSGATLILAKDSGSTVHALSGTAGLLINPGGTMQLGGSGGDQIYASSVLVDNGAFDLAGNNEGFDGLNGSGIVTSSSGNSTLQLGENNGSSTFAGTIMDGNGQLSLTKAGSGNLTLNGANTYTGGTTVNVGKLMTSTASTGNGNYTVAGAATLGVNVSAANGSLHVNSLNLGDSSLEFQNLNSAATPAITVGNLNLNGNITVNVTSGSFVAGQNYPLIGYSGSSGDGTFTLGALPDGVVATLNTSASPITLQVSSTVNLTPTNIVTTFTNGTLTLQWPTDHTGWLLESNSVDLGNANDWFVVPDSENTNSVSIQIDPNSPYVFYRLRH